LSSAAAAQHPPSPWCAQAKPSTPLGEVGGPQALAMTCGSFSPAFDVFLGSSNTFIAGNRAARMGDMTRHCNPASAAPRRQPWRRPLQRRSCRRRYRRRRRRRWPRDGRHRPSGLRSSNRNSVVLESFIDEKITDVTITSDM